MPRAPRTPGYSFSYLYSPGAGNGEEAQCSMQSVCPGTFYTPEDSGLPPSLTPYNPHVLQQWGDSALRPMLLGVPPRCLHLATHGWDVSPSVLPTVPVARAHGPEELSAPAW